MHAGFRLFFGTIAMGVVCLSACGLLAAQQAESPASPTDPVALPDAPRAQADLAEDLVVQAPASSQQNPPAATDSSSSAAQGSSAQTAPGAVKSDHDKAEEQLKAQEHQRVAGVMAAFNTTRNRDALPLSASQKFRLFFRSSTDPWPFFLNGITALIGQANNTPPEWGQGVQGYAKRFGANYSDYFIGNFFGNAVLPSLLREDPRYFQKGSGSHSSRFWWAAGSSFWCRRDNGKWGPNYANVGGNLIGAAIGRAYYPASSRSVTDTITDGITVTVEGVVGAEVIEFWPDLAHYMKRKHNEKMARKAAQKKESQ